MRPSDVGADAPLGQRLLDVARHRRDHGLALLRRLVELESPTEEKAYVDRVGEVLVERLAALGFEVERDRQERFGDHIVARRPGSPRAPTVMLVGHFDTVYPVGTLATMPFAVRQDVVVGPGVLDMKGGLTVALEAITVLDAVRGSGTSRTERSPGLLVVMNSDEEPGSPTSRPLIERLAAEVDVAMVFEPGVPGKSVTTGRKGVGIFRVHVDGHSAHAGAEPEKGASAIHQLAHTIVELLAVADPAEGTTVNVGAVGGGRLPYVVADAATAAIDVRAPTTAEARRVLEAFERLEAAAPAIPRTSLRIEGSFHRPPFESSEDDALWRLGLEAGRAAGLDLVRHTTGGASDANNISAVGVPTLDGLGPDGSGAHGPDEHFLLDTFHRKIAMAASILAGVTDE